ncbi:MAG: phosphoribosyltransferase [Thermoprotei archaeon]|nr:MAG: phosphoribosyltransferase [Thermoprotei archaeon]
MVKMPARKITWDYVVDLCKKLALRIRDDGYRPDVIVAIARGGYVPARLLCDYLGVTDLLSIKVEHWLETGKAEKEAKITYPFNYDLSGKKVLVVDDICDTGDSFIIAVEHIRRNSKPEVIKTAAMQIIPATSKFTPDYVVEELKSWEWQLYPWCDYEDKTNLIKRIMKENPRMELWSIEEIREKFKEYYGVEFKESEFEEVLSYMEWTGLVETVEVDGKKKYKLKVL